MAPKHCDGPCFAPPHPDLLRRTRQEILKAQGTPNESVLKAKAQRLLQADRRIPGMNDGTIFPPSHFKEKASIMEMSRAALERAPLRGPLKAAVILVEFQDVKMTAGTKERMLDRFFSTGKIPTGSVNEYYQEASNGKVSFTGEVVGPFTLSHDMAFYANGQSGMGWPEPNAMTMADEAVLLATGSMNFAPYDNDGNGYVDAFIVVHAGGDASETGSTNDIWSLKWNIPNEREVDGVKIYAFLTVGEYALTGVCAHEIGHLVFGWPDLYDTDYSSRGVGSWCLMSFGSWDLRWQPPMPPISLVQGEPRMDRHSRRDRKPRHHPPRRQVRIQDPSPLDQRRHQQPRVLPHREQANHRIRRISSRLRPSCLAHRRQHVGQH